MLSEIKQRQTDTIKYHLYLRSKVDKPELIDTENILLVTRGGVWQGHKGNGQKVQTISYKMHKSWRQRDSNVTIVNKQCHIVSLKLLSSS